MCGQSNGVHNGQQFKMSTILKQLRSCEISLKPIMIVKGVKWTFFLISDNAYPIQTYLQKIWITHNPNDVDTIWYDSNPRVGIYLWVFE
jgi:hypothetical protein